MITNQKNRGDDWRPTKKGSSPYRLLSRPHEAARRLRTAFAKAAVTATLAAVFFGGMGIAAEVKDPDSLIQAARNGETLTAKALLWLGANPELFHSQALSEAAFAGEIETVWILLETGIDVRGEAGAMAVDSAAFHGHADIVSLLISRGAPIGERTLAYAVRQGHADIVLTLLDAMNVIPPLALWDAIKGSVLDSGGSPDIAALLLQRGANLHFWDDMPLRKAVHDGDTKMVKLLLRYGADVHARDGEALRNAVVFARVEIVEALLDAGAFVPPDGGELLRIADEQQSGAIAALLRERMAQTRECLRPQLARP